MELKPVRLNVSILRTVLFLLDNDRALRPESATVLEFKRVTQNLIEEIESENGITVQSVSETTRNSVFKAINNHR